jgi:hypothetical protein
VEVAGLVEPVGLLAAAEETGFTDEAGGDEEAGCAGAEDAGGGVPALLVDCRHWEYHGFCSTQDQPEVQVVLPE